MPRGSEREPDSPLFGSKGGSPAGEARRGGWHRTLHRFAHSPITKLATGAFLLLTALVELLEGLILDLDRVLDPSHALVVLSVVLIAQSLAEILEAVEHFDEAEGEE